MASFSKNASCAMLPLSLALAGATCIAQPTEDAQLGTIAQAVTTLCAVDGGDGGDAGYLTPYLDALEGSPYLEPSYTASYTGWGLEPGYTDWGGWGPSYAGSYTAWGGLSPGYLGLGVGGYYYGSEFASPYYYGGVLTPAPALPCP
jgi:hypothetical protein